MTKRISRKALALAAIGVIAAPAFATVANAQIGTQAIATTLKAVGPVPSGVTGANVSISCKNTTNNPGDVVAGFALTPGQTATIPSFQLNAASSCKVTSTNAGSANTNLGTITISVGGATSTSTIGAFATGNGPTVATGYIPVTSATDIQITMSYAQITVKKVVVGDEATAGFAYPMSIACSNPVAPIFVSPANGLEAGGAGSWVTIPGATTAVAAQRAFIAPAASNANITYTWQVVAGGAVSTSTTTGANPIPAGAFSGSQVVVTPAVVTPIGYSAGDLVVPGGGFVTVTTVNGAGVLTPPAPGLNTWRIYDANATAATITAAQTAAGPTITSGIQVIAGTNANIIAFPVVTTVPSASFSLTPGAGYTISTNGGAAVPTVAATRYDFIAGTTYATDVDLLLFGALASLAPVVAGTPSVATGIRVYDYRTDPATIPAGGILGNWANLGTGTPVSLYTQTVNAINALSSAQPTPNAAAGFTGAFTLKGGESRSFSFNEFPNLTTASVCEVWETNGGGATATGFSSTQSADAFGNARTPLNGVTNSAGRWQSALTTMNQTITVTNSFYGDMIISKVVTGDPKTNVATYEISVACDKGGPKDTFLIKDRQSKVYQNIASGTNCLITETKSDGAVASYKDNSGDNTTDGRVTIKRRPIGGCGDVLSVTGAPTNATPGGPAPTTTFNECWASIIITNDYNPPATTEAPKAPAAAPATAAPATAAPAVAPAPAVAVDATPTFAG
jgi:hypothetical protein